MSKLPEVLPDVLWLSVSPALRQFDRPLLQKLSQSQSVARWEYSQTLDEPNSFDAALVLLHDYLKQRSHPIHLIGHSTSGLLGLLYARQHPERVKSLTLLSVGVHPAVDWQAHYYAQAQFLNCSRLMLLTQMVHNLLGRQPQSMTQAWVKVLDRDLLTSLSPHTLFQRMSIPPAHVSIPLMVCGGSDDIIIDPMLFQGWRDWMKAGDRLWLCPRDEYFFHYNQSELTGEQILSFWSSLQTPNNLSSCTPLLQFQSLDHE